MHLVFLNQYYPPDAAPTGVMLQAVAEECARQGHEVTVICAAGGYAGGVKLNGAERHGQELFTTCSAGEPPGSGSKTEKLKTESRGGNQDSKSWTERGIHSASSSTSSLSTINHQLSTSPPESSLSTINPQLSTSPPESSLSTINSQLSTSSVHIHRLPATRYGRGTFIGKLADYASYYLGVAWRLGTMSPPPDRIVALTTPPYLSVLARFISKLRGADHAHWVMDLYPDVMVAHGMLAEGGWKHRLLAGLARWGFGGRRCAAVLTLGPDMAERVRRLNIEHPTSNIERRNEGNRSDASASAAEDSSASRSTINQPRSTSSTTSPSSIQNSKFKIQNHSVSWVPLWGAGWGNIDPASPTGCAGTRHRTSNVEHRSEDDGSGVSATVAGCSSTLPNQNSTISNPQSSISPSAYQPSTLDSQLSPIGSSLRGMNESRDESRGPEPPADFPVDQESTIKNHQSSISPISSSSIQNSKFKIQNPSSASLRFHRGWSEDELIVMYSGNMGLGHRFGEILEIAGARVSSPAMPMEGESPAREELLASSPVNSFAPHRPCESGDSRSGGACSSTLQNQPSTINNHQSSISPSSSNSQPSTLNPRLLPIPLHNQPTCPGVARKAGSTINHLSRQSPEATPDQLLPKQRFVFYGGGKRRGEIEAFLAAHPGAPVELHDYAPAEELSAHLMSADLHLVSLEPAWTGTMVPSKLQGIFAVGRPVVFVGARESSIGRWVEESGGGWVVAPGDVAGLRAAIDEARDPEVLRIRGKAAGRFAKEHFNRETNVRQVVEVLAG